MQSKGQEFQGCSMNFAKKIMELTFFIGDGGSKLWWFGHPWFKTKLNPPTGVHFLATIFKATFCRT